MSLSHANLAFLSALISAVGFIPYAVGIYRGTIKPHMFTWLIWIIVTGLVFLAQLLGGGGPGAWATAMITFTCAIAFIASIFRGEKSRTTFDWVCFVLAFIAIPLWYFSGTPRLSIILMTCIETLAFGPTVRKTWAAPYSESLLYFLACIFKYLLAAVALDVWTFDTTFYPLTTCFLATTFAFMIMVRRLAVPKPL